MKQFFTARTTTQVLTLAALALASCMPGAWADEPSRQPTKNLISVHVLDTQSGQPGEGMEVILEHRQADTWVQLADDRTGDSGRISALYPAGRARQPGTYRVRFETGPWYAGHDASTFFPEIPVVFQITDTSQHYHIPLLLSPYGYTTYRGS